MSEDLEPIGPHEAVELYLDHRETDLSDKSLENQRYRLLSFVEFCEADSAHALSAAHAAAPERVHDPARIYTQVELS